MTDYDEVLRGKYPAKAHAQRVADYIRAKVPAARAKHGVIYLESKATRLLEDNDEPEPFRQRRPFFYLTGSTLADAAVAYDMASGKSTLFIPPVDADTVIWSGLPVTAEEAKARWDVDAVRYVEEVNGFLAGLAQRPGSVVFAMAGQVADGTTFVGFDEADMELLREAVEEERVVKDEYELALLARANAVSSDAHRAVLQRARGAANERELEAVFLAHCVAHGAREQSYSSIVASGRAAATLHYVRNDQPLAGKLNLLLDAGAEWDCYAADITRTFPLGGRFSPESRAIYDIVLRMQLECIDLLREGVLWDDVHLHAHAVAIDGLLDLGILRGDKADILRDRTSVAFFPHGLGHYLGMDTHDVGGHPNYADKDPMFRYLRVRGTLPAGSVVTVEPGIYFCEFIIRPYLKDPVHAKYIDTDVLDKYWDVGGVRIEDNIVITKTGCTNLTPAIKDPEELEKIVSGSA
ncbi:prolidase [Grosmannia clavigera kw1407]|uniref:Xaa-Pro aminopeptidase n=1 Tax=Grosmannia clavigera (strain kw1407 / UAMH 11150) TaxID=655863 RepID=F0XQC4_GROCL|nr:prolidase [Grosmannia clavigera kw1407]EFX00436.1 prolidase [Grosmannia clavigera kw1407]